MRSSAISVCLGLVAMSAGGCAQLAPAAGAPGRVDLAEIARGQAFAQTACAGCHAVGASGSSPDPRAPPFAVLAGHYVGVSLQRKLTEIAETGHYAMPALRIHADEANDVAAYLESLNAGASR